MDSRLLDSQDGVIFTSYEISEIHVHYYLEGNRHKGLLLETHVYNAQFFCPFLFPPPAVLEDWKRGTKY
jgi:hypothetical protein